MKIKFLGTGSSSGIPKLGCKCKRCISKKETRSRCSLFIQFMEKNILIDPGPDFRMQMLKNNFNDIDLVLITHSHADHVLGFNDLFELAKFKKKQIICLCSKTIALKLKKKFDYIFENKNFLYLQNINQFSKNKFFGLIIIPIKLYHGKMPIYGFLFKKNLKKVAYLTDCSKIPDKSLNLLKDLDLLIIDMLKIESDNMHFGLKNINDLITNLKPKICYITHISHNLILGQAKKALAKHNILIASDEMSIKL